MGCCTRSGPFQIWIDSAGWTKVPGQPRPNQNSKLPSPKPYNPEARSPKFHEPRMGASRQARVMMYRPNTPSQARQSRYTQPPDSPSGRPTRLCPYLNLALQSSVSIPVSLSLHIYLFRIQEREIGPPGDAPSLRGVLLASAVDCRGPRGPGALPEGPQGRRV